VLVVRLDIVAYRSQQESDQSFAGLLDEYLDLLHDFNNPPKVELPCVEELPLRRFVPQRGGLKQYLEQWVEDTAELGQRVVNP